MHYLTQFFWWLWKWTPFHEIEGVERFTPWGEMRIGEFLCAPYANGTYLVLWFTAVGDHALMIQTQTPEEFLEDPDPRGYRGEISQENFDFFLRWHRHATDQDKPRISHS